MRVTLDIPRSDIPKAIGMTALEGVVLDASFTVNNEPLNIRIKSEKAKRVKVEPKQKGEFGTFWRDMITDGSTNDQQFFNHPDFQEVLGLEAPVSLVQAKEALYKVFGVESLSFVSPAQFIEWCTCSELHSIATLANKIAFQ